MPAFKKAYKKLHDQEFLLAYEWERKKGILLALGVHEDFHCDLKKNLKNS